MFSLFSGHKAQPKSEEIYIDTRNRLTGTTSDFTYSLNIPQSRYTHCVLLSATIPKSYYSITSTDTFILEETSGTATISITAGNYSRTSLATTIKNALNLASPGGYTYDITFPKIGTTVDNGHYTFTVTLNTGDQPYFRFTSTNSEIYEKLGFNNGESYQFSSDSLESVNVIKIQAEDTLFLRSDLVQNRNDAVLQEIFTSSTASYGSIVWYNPFPTEYTKIIGINSSNVYRFYLTNESGKIIDLNGVNAQYTLKLFDYATS